jgi:hypothetical protein
MQQKSRRCAEVRDEEEESEEDDWEEEDWETKKCNSPLSDSFLVSFLCTVFLGRFNAFWVHVYNLLNAR